MSNEVQDRMMEEDSEPGVLSSLGRGWTEMKDNFLVFLLAVLVVCVFMIPMNIGGEHDDSALLGVLETAYMFLIYPIIGYGADLIFLRGVRGDKVEVKTIFDGFNNYVNIVLAALLVMGLIGIGLVVFIFPGIYVACRLAFVAYLVMDEGLDPIAAVEASWRITRGHAWKIFVLGFLSIFIFIFGLILLVVGVFPAMMWIKASFAALYLAITGPTTDVEPAEPTMVAG
ncbi:MAG: hypothetical protein Q8L60_00895 [Gammaproteobacteria bacterium]|nr:hypothetical protein [Gammaproteobacteria bacterium]MDP2141986.1 hypothetical protein [Gammaproteobacteria bacterium]MDP2348436.1 hypothetical protein [Gammaproteobacteria bacterium]